VTPAAALLLLLAVVAVAAPPPSVLVVTLDTTRADRLGCYGRTRASTPNLDALAARGALFLEASTVVPETLPAHVSLFSGRVPSGHGVKGNGLFTVPADLPLLARSLKAKGYATAAVVAASVLDHRFGLSGGFDLYDDAVDGATGERRADAVTGRAREVLRGLKPPFLLWVHYFDPHYPYDAPGTPAGFDPYDGEIAFMDRHLGGLLGELQSRGLEGATFVVAAGDHGELLGEHGEMTHGIQLYRGALQVPLVLAGPGIHPGKVPTPVSLVDLFPTLLDLLGLPIPGGLDGMSLKPLLSGEPLRRGRLYAESYEQYYAFGWSPLRALFDASEKYIHAPKPELYDLRKDPDESRNLAGAEPARAARLRGELERRHPTSGAEAAPAARVSDELKKHLQSLGYLGTAGAQPAKGDLPNPADLIDTVPLVYLQGPALLRQGKHREVVAMMKGVLRRSPRNLPAMNLLGLAYMGLGAWGEAAKVLEGAMELNPALPDNYANLAKCQAMQGLNEKAEATFKAMLQADPGYAQGRVMYAQFLVSRRRLPEAGKLLEEGRAEGAWNSDAAALLGAVRLAAGGSKEAEALLEEALKLNPGNAAARLQMAMLLGQTGRQAEGIAHLEKAYALDPGNPQVLKTYAKAMLQTGRNTEARAAIERILAAEPGGPEAEQWKEALRSIREAAGHG
jgi:arylsulfatase A-like enzyme/Tfp pilus assembly protein PilF